MESSHSTARKLIPILIASSVRRCHLSGTLCRLTISLKFFQDSSPPSVWISISDTGVGSSLVEFRELNATALELPDKWGGLLSITTTGIHDNEINYYNLNLKQALASKTRLKRLPSIQKNVGTFSGTEVCFSTSEEDTYDELMAWVIHFVQKMLVLKDQDVALELIVERVDNQVSRLDHLLQQNDHSLTMSGSSMDHLVGGLENYVLKHGDVVEEKCQTCVAKREHLKVGKGQASRKGNSRGSRQIIEVAVVIATVSSQPCCWRANTSVTQVLYFQDFAVSSISHTSLAALTTVDWQSYGMKLKNNFVDSDGHAELEWEHTQLFAHIDIAVHSYSIKTTEHPCLHNPAEKNLIKKAVKNALDDLKAKHTGLFLSSNASKVLDYVPDLSRTIASLIMTSNDLDFQGECASLLGLHSVGAGQEELVESCIYDKLVGAIEMNDRKTKEERGIAPAPYLFECESPFEEEEYADEDPETAEEDMDIFVL